MSAGSTPGANPRPRWNWWIVSSTTWAAEANTSYGPPFCSCWASCPDEPKVKVTSRSPVTSSFWM